MTISDKEAECILKAELTKFEAQVERLVKVPLTDIHHFSGGFVLDTRLICLIIVV
ncbi:glycoside hydrolase family protein [Brucella gallinifaecis]|uniref:glycoside hydrolase family protein n=1 Tax=Brucella gallinifaecis TaxID=215590 RepID=UPI0036391A67